MTHSGKIGRCFFIMVTGLVLSLWAQNIPYKLIGFEDIKPAGFVLSTCWEAVGIDNNDNVYIVFGDGGKSGGPEDCAVFRYNPNTNQSKFLGTLRGTLKAAGNLPPVTSWSSDEDVPKGHAHIPYMNGKMFIATQPFHDLQFSLTELAKYRGSHIIAINTATGTLEDLSANQPKGVFQENQGLIDMQTIPEKGLVFGFSHPKGDVVVYDTKTNQVTIGPGTGQAAVARDIIVTKDARAYYCYGWGSHAWYRYDYNTKETKKMSFTTSTGFINARTSTRDGKTHFVSGYAALFKFETQTEQMTKVCDIGAEELWALCLSLDEKKVYAMTSKPGQKLYEIDLATKQVSTLKDFSSILGSSITGSDVRDSKGRIYFSRHNYGSKPGQLIQIDVSSRSGPAPSTVNVTPEIRNGSRAAVGANHAPIEKGAICTLTGRVIRRGVPKGVYAKVNNKHVSSFEVNLK